MESRYDPYAQWYAEFARDWSPSCLPYLPQDLHGQRVLDLACGIGTLSALIAGRGARVTAVDASAQMLDHAALTHGLQYRQGDATTTDWWNGEPFDGVVSNMALMDIEDLDAALATIATVTSPSGWVLIALLHPCFPGRDDTGTLPSWSPEHGYAWEGWWTTNTDGVRGRGWRPPSDAVDLPQRHPARRLGHRRGDRAPERCAPRLGASLPKEPTRGARETRSGSCCGLVAALRLSRSRVVERRV